MSYLQSCHSWHSQLRLYHAEMSAPMNVQLLNDEFTVATNVIEKSNASINSARLSSDPSEPSCPIERLPFELLSQIFELCGRDNWTGSLMISWVSRRWREIILATPLAWCFINGRQGCDTNSVEKYLRYYHLTAQRPVHFVFGFQTISTTAFSTIGNNLHCLTIHTLPPNFYGLTFPNLHQLNIWCNVGLSRLTASYLPKLRHLWCASSFKQKTENFVLLETFIFITAEAIFWVQPLEDCAKTLVSLKLTIFAMNDLSLQQNIVFPRLICLHIHRYDAQSWTLHFETPRLKAYIETRTRRRGQILLHNDLETVIRARFNDTVPMPPLPRLRLLQLETSDGYMVKKMIEAYYHNNLYPTLNQIEVMSIGSHLSEASQIVQEMNQSISISILDHLDPLPGSLNTVCNGLAKGVGADNFPDAEGIPM